MGFCDGGLGSVLRGVVYHLGLRLNVIAGSIIIEPAV